MSQDFFLINRAHQVARICRGQTGKFDFPGGAVRSKLPEELKSFFALLDRVCLLGSGEEQSGESSLSETQRSDLEEFERAIVRLRFSANDHVKLPAVQLIKAIFADTGYFSGLKPLPQYTDVFAYELLFPSWLNLLTATMLPQASNGKPRLEGKRQGTLFQFLGRVRAAGDPSEKPLVGYLTLIASRFDAPVCEELLQRLADLFSREGSLLLDAIDSIDANSRDAREFAVRLQDYLTVRYSMLTWPTADSSAIAYKRPATRVLPPSLTRLLQELHGARDWNGFFEIAHPLRQLVNSQDFMALEFATVLDQHSDYAASLLALVVQETKAGVQFLPADCQACVAEMIQSEAAQSSQIDAERISHFATKVAPRLAGYGETTANFFCKNFIKDATNRTRLLDASASDAQRGKLSDSIIERAGKTDDDSRFLEWLRCATIVSPDDTLLESKATLSAIDAVVSNRSIGNKEFSDLVGDLQSNIQDAIKYLANPIMAASGKSPRLASLYLTLSEITNTHSTTGKADNFSVVRAKYAAITNFDPS